MKNLFSIFTLVVLVLFTSSASAEIIQTENYSESNIELTDHSELTKNMDKEIKDELAFPSNTVQVTKVSSSVNGGDLVVNFTSSANFFNANLETIQTLQFTDGSGKESTLTFSITSHSYSNGVLQVAFNIGGNNIGGLNLKSIQYIVIDDILID